MTTSQNVDRIYQLLCRVIRKRPEGHKKLFFKVAPNIHSDYYKYIMTAVLSLSDESFFTKFNGKNFSDMIIPVIKTKKDHHEPNNNNGGNGKPKPKTLKPIDFEGLPVFEFFQDLYHKKDALLHVYAYTTVRNVRAEFLNRMPTNYWTFDNCLEDALKFKSKIEWQKNSNSAYNAARFNGWLNDCCMHMMKLRNDDNYWTKEKCLESALKYQTREEWKQNESAALGAALKHKWYYECTVHMQKLRGFWTKELCLESALKYQTLKEWETNDKKSFEASQNNGWYMECSAHMTKAKRNYWTKEKCIEDAQKYHSKSEWQKKNRSAYGIAINNGWLNECSEHMEKLTGFWTKEMCVESALKYNKYSEWIKNEGGAYGAARYNGWLKECRSHMTIKISKPNGYWTKEKCIEDAQKYQTISTWQKNATNSYHVAHKNGWMFDCTKHMKKPHIRKILWTKEKCVESAQRFEIKTEWVNNDYSAFNAARKNGWMHDCTKHMKELKIQWTKEKCIENASNYTTISDWQRSNAGAAHAARKNGWMNDCTTHMTERFMWTKELCLQDAIKYNRIIDWIKGEGSSGYYAARKNGWIGECTTHMINNK